MVRRGGWSRPSADCAVLDLAPVEPHCPVLAVEVQLEHVEVVCLPGARAPAARQEHRLRPDLMW